MIIDLDSTQKSSRADDVADSSFLDLGKMMKIWILQLTRRFQRAKVSENFGDVS